MISEQDYFEMLKVLNECPDEKDHRLETLMAKLVIAKAKRERHEATQNFYKNLADNLNGMYNPKLGDTIVQTEKGPAIARSWYGNIESTPFSMNKKQKTETSSYNYGFY